MLNKIILKFGDNQFYTALKVTFAALLSFLVFYNLSGFTAAFTVTLGAILCAPIDISSNFKHKVIGLLIDRKSTRLNSSHVRISYAVFCLKKKKKNKHKNFCLENYITQSLILVLDD